MAVIESAWESHPGYRIDLVPYPGVARAWHGDLLLAESTAALRVIETDHVERLYFPERDVRLDLFAPNDHHTICPFKGEADYWTLTAADPAVEDVFWTYRDLFDEVAGLKGYLGVYHEKVRVELETRWPDDARAVRTNPFPVWGDQSDLLRLIDAQESGPNRFVAPGYHERSRNVVEGGQLLAQSIVAASKALPGQRVTSAFITFPKAASFDDPIELVVEPLRQGRTFSSVAVRAEQNGALVSPSLMLMDSGAPDTIRDAAPMPDVPGPYESEPYDMWVTGRDLRIRRRRLLARPRPGRPAGDLRLDAVPGQPRRAVPAERAGGPGDNPLDHRRRPCVRTRGSGEADAHVTLSTGIMSVSIAFHDDAPLDQWFLYENPAIWSGRGLAQGDGRIFTQSGTLVASYSVQAMIRGFVKPPEAMGMDSTNAM